MFVINKLLKMTSEMFAVGLISVTLMVTFCFNHFIGRILILPSKPPIPYYYFTPFTYQELQKYEDVLVE